ncbi:hypothetical protein FRC12_006289 [Ceratobasidium sp. 428]|nr:hypothetical protein FRC12_006289 [Ceratobasidium sp. 428]
MLNSTDADVAALLAAGKGACSCFSAELLPLGSVDLLEPKGATAASNSKSATGKKVATTNKKAASTVKSATTTATKGFEAKAKSQTATTTQRKTCSSAKAWQGLLHFRQSVAPSFLHESVFYRFDTYE